MMVCTQGTTFKLKTRTVQYETRTVLGSVSIMVSKRQWRMRTVTKTVTVTVTVSRTRTRTRMG